MAKQSLPAVLDEMRSPPNVSEMAVRERIQEEAFPLSSAVLKSFRLTEAYRTHVLEKMRLGVNQMMEAGNLYTGALPAWLAAGLEQALAEDLDWEGKEVVLLGYGSGDAADAMPLTIAPGWQKAAEKIRLAEALADPIDLSFEQYLALREHAATEELGYQPAAEFIVERVGSQTEHAFQDAGIEYYRYIN